MSLARFAATAVALDVVHDVMDHVVQTDADAAAKVRSRDWQGAMFAHAGGQALAQGAALVVLEIGRGQWWRVPLAAAVIGGSHAFLDRRWPVLGLLRRTGSAAFAAGTLTLPERDVLIEAQPGRRELVRGTVQEAAAALPLHGGYLADQSLHRLVTLIVAVAMTLG